MKPSRLLWVSFLLLFALFLSACGGSSSTDEIAVGNPAPDFSLTDSEGHTVTLAAYSGQPVLLFFHMAGG
jgi:cytochrome oxidase Cu insertion factor (SCO1/SenC/PrrC family)